MLPRVFASHSQNGSSDTGDRFPRNGWRVKGGMVRISALLQLLLTSLDPHSGRCGTKRGRRRGRSERAATVVALSHRRDRPRRHLHSPAFAIDSLPPLALHSWHLALEFVIVSVLPRSNLEQECPHAR